MHRRCACSVLQCVAGVAVCCSVLQCVVCFMTYECLVSLICHWAHRRCWFTYTWHGSVRCGISHSNLPLFLLSQVSCCWKSNWMYGSTTFCCKTPLSGTLSKGVCRSISPFLCLSVSLYLCLSVSCLCSSVSLCLSVSLSLCLCVCVKISLHTKWCHIYIYI